MSADLTARSYAKTTLAGVALVVLTLLSASLSLTWLPPLLGLAGASLAALAPGGLLAILRLRLAT